MREFCSPAGELVCKYLSLALFLCLFPILGHSQCADGNLEGRVFLDNNVNGSYDTSESGISGILVTLYDANGVSVTTDFTNSLGEYEFTGLSNNDSYRVEVSYLQGYSSSHMGADHLSDTRYATVPSCDLTFGLTNASKGCSTNPEILVTCFVRGDISEFVNNSTIVGLDYQFNPASPVTSYAKKYETGSIWGLAYDESNATVYSSAFVKQYAALSPFGHDAIFKTNTQNNTTQLFVQLSSLGINTGALAIRDEQDCAYGDQVGKYGLGNIVLSQDGGSLYVIDIFSNSLVRVPLNNPTAANVQQFSIPQPNCTGGVARSFALEYHNGKYYVGVTCDGSVSRNQTNSVATVYEFDPVSTNFTQIFQTDYLKGYWDDSNPGGFFTSHWLTDIDFTDEGNMLLGLSDRYGHRYCDGNFGRVDQQYPDLLVVWDNNGVWTLESNGSAGSLTGTGVNNGEGPSGGEFFGDDFYPGNPSYHNEVALGSMFVLPGSGEVVAAVYDPLLNAYAGGLHRYNTSTGAISNAKELYAQNLSDLFGKATGFGEIIATCPRPKPEIGNYVWFDDDGDGLQGPAEGRVANIDLILYDSNCVEVGVATTDANGNYTFNNSNVSNSGLTNPIFDGLVVNEQYYISIDPELYDPTSGSYNVNNTSYNITTDNVSSKWGSDLIASANICSDVKHLIPASIQADDEVNHTFDIGFVKPSNFDLALRKTIGANQNPKLNEDVTFYIDVFNQGDVTATEVEVTDYINSNFTFVPANNPNWTLSGNKAKYTHTSPLIPSDNFRVEIVLTVSDNNVQDFENYAEISNTVDQFGNVNSDIDSSADDDNTNDVGAIANGSTDNEIMDDGTLDEDDHDVALVEVVDIALRKVINESRPYQPGERVTFNITVINQGNVDLDYFTIQDYYPTTLTYLVAPSQNGWTAVSPGILSFTDNEGLLVGQSKVIQVTFQVGQFEAAESQVNIAEVIHTRSNTGNDRDLDSNPDADPTNDLLVDDEIQDHGSIDEDDHDVAEIIGLKVDLALTKKSNKTSLQRGDDVKFTITVYNQGEVKIDNILVVDYLPNYLILNDSKWDYDQVSGNAYYTISVPNGLSPGSNVDVTLDAIVSETAEISVIDNYAEIMAATDMFGNDVAQYDCDSNPDGDASNDVGGRPDTEDDDDIMDPGDRDEDDSDPARINIVDFEVTIACECLGNATTSSNGQFRDLMVVTAPSGQNWYLDYVNGLFENNSADPPAMPNSFTTGPNGFSLIETAIGNGYSEYRLSGVHVENVGYEVRIASDDGVFIQHINNGCSYEDPIVTTDEGESIYSACANSTRTYSVDLDDFCNVLWTLPDGTTSTDPTVNYTWGASPGSISLEVDCGGITCIQPRVINVDLGGATGAIACIYDINVSMDSDCSILVNPLMIHAGDMDPDAAYGVMLLDAQMNPIADNMITVDHIGETLVAKLIDACSGNSCWANIFVEDKMPPDIQCGDISLPCYAMNTYMPIATDNCGTVVEVVMLSETITPLVCDDDFVKEVTRSYQATDSYGNVSEPCFQTILVERFDFSQVEAPENFEVINGTALKCSEVIFGEDGTPALELTGVPQFWGEDLYPFPDYYCNVGIDYETLTISEEGCVRKYMRTWTVYEAHCGLGVIETYVQTIEIEDVEPPTVVCGDNVFLTTSGESCERNVFLPPPYEIQDDCEDGTFQVDIKYPGGFLNNVPDGGYAVLPAGTHTITYVVYDACGNQSQCDMVVTVADETSPTAICDQNTIVSLRGDGTAEAYASTFDDGSYDDCNLYTLLVQRIDPPADCPCDLPSFHDMDYLGELDGHFYYLSKTKITSFMAYAYSEAMGGHPAIIETDNENSWLRNQVDGLLADDKYFIGLSDEENEGIFEWSNGFPVNYTNWNGGNPVNIADHVIVNPDGTWSVAPSGVEAAYVLEITDPCGWSDFVNFCCEDAGDEHMIALRAVDYFGRITNCMAMVEVQDKIAPEITCPDDMTITCEDIIDFGNLAGTFGMATAVDGCQADVTENPALVNIDICGVGEIKRTFVARDANGFVTCDQLITIESVELFDEDRIVFPPDFYSDAGCDAGQLIPENLPEGFQEPIIDERFCDLADATYSDNIFFFAGNDSDACFKILRSWTVIDWCTYDEDDSDINNIDEATDDGIIPGLFRDQQTIKINNTVKPVISVSGPTEVCTFDCDEGYIDLIATATDDCTPGVNMVWQWEVDLFSDGSADITGMSGAGNTIVASGTYPVGTHTILYTFEDRCGNMESTLFSFTIKNCKLPTAACIDGLAVGLEAMDLDGDGIFDTEMGCVWSDSFDASSSHPCGFDVEIFFCDDPSDPSTYTTEKCFDCADCGTQTVNICVVDEFDNVDFCVTSVEVQDNNNVDFCSDAGECIIPPVDDILITDCSPDFDPNVIGGFPSITADCFCDDFEMTFLDTPVDFPNDDCVGLLRTWTVTPNCGCIDGAAVFSQTIRVMNQTNPTIDAPAGVTGFANDNCEAFIDLDVAIASGQCNTGLQITNDFNGGGENADGNYPIGSTVVVYTVTDDCGNTGTSTTVVIVVDEQSPECVALNTTLSLDSNNQATVTVGEVSGTATDNCDPDPDVFFLMIDGSVASSIDFDCENIGSNTVTLIVTDEAGNSTTCESNITVEDTTVPVCSVQDILVTIDSGTSITIPSSMINDGSFDNCSEVTISPDNFEFDCSQLGTNNVVLTVTDASGNVSTCSAVVTVEETVAPVCSIEDLTINLIGEDMIVGLEDIDFTVTDACGEINTITYTDIMVNCDLLNGQATTTLTGDDGINIEFEDTFGNTSTCSADIVLVDISEIVCVTQDITVSLGTAGQVFIQPEDIDNGSSAGCDAMLGLELDIDMFGCNNLGDNTVILTVTTDAGDSEQCSAIVTVIDDVAPTLLSNFCPPGMDVLCDADVSDLTVFGEPNMAGVMDNCPASFSFEEEVVMNLNDCNIGVISRTFTLLDINGNVLNDADGNPLACTQIINVGGPANPITENDITWPSSPVSLDCSDPDINDMPIVDESGAECSSVTVTSEDVIVNGSDDCNFTIQRTFTVTDDCQLPGGVFTFTQVINITDSTPPAINVSPGDQTIDLTIAANSCSAIITLNYNVTDDCPQSGDVVVTLDAPGLISQTVVDENGDISFDVEFCALDEDVTITMTATDGCGNVSTDEIEVTVIGEGCLEYSCQKFIFALEDDGESEINSQDYDVVDSQCGYVEVDISYNPMDINDTLEIYNCQTIIDNGINPNINDFLYFWVDGELIDSCRIVVFFSNDPNGDGDMSDGWQEICGLTALAGFVTGEVMTADYAPIEDVEIELMGSPFEEVMTTNLGTYAFPSMTYGSGQYVISPKKDGDYLNGISTLDLILIQKHILRSEEFDSPYLHIAADVNDSKSISSLDIIELRKMILGINDKFSNNTSWRMVDRNFNFADPNDPLENGYPEQYNIFSFDNDMNVGFVGVKIGDINNSAVTSFSAEQVVETRSNNDLLVNFSERDFVDGELFDIQFTINLDKGFEGTQFSIDIDNDLLIVEEVLVGDETLCKASNINIADIANGKMNLSWHALTEKTGSVETLFTVKVLAKMSGSVSKALSIYDKGLKAESYYNSQVGDVVLLPDTGLDSENEIVLYQNSPNPWSETTSIKYYLSSDQNVSINVYDINGKLVKSIIQDAPKGMNEIEISKTEIPAAGVLFYELITDNYKISKKMLLVK